MKAIRINNVTLNADTRSQAREIAKESGGKIVDRGTFAAKRWGVLVNRIHCVKRDGLASISRIIVSAAKQTKVLHQPNGKTVRVMTKKSAMQFAMLPRNNKAA